jgi:hypothetical protein
MQRFSPKCKNCWSELAAAMFFREPAPAAAPCPLPKTLHASRQKRCGQESAPPWEYSGLSGQRGEHAAKHTGLPGGAVQRSGARSSSALCVDILLAAGNKAAVSRDAQDRCWIFVERVALPATPHVCGRRSVGSGRPSA